MNSVIQLKIIKIVMANLKSSKKDAARALEKRTFNRSVKSRIKTYKKKLFSTMLVNNIEEINKSFSNFVSIVAKACKKNIIKRNKMSRDISRLHIHVKKHIANISEESQKK